jgi:hypothetical protein
LGARDARAPNHCTTTVPVMTAPWTVQKYGNEPAIGKTWSNVAPVWMPESQFASGVQPTVHVPDVVECVPLAHTQCTVPPTGIVDTFVPLTRSTKTMPPPDPTSTVAIAAFGVTVGVGLAPPVVGVIVGVIVAPPGVTDGVPGPGEGVAVRIGGPVTVSLLLQCAAAKTATTIAAKKNVLLTMRGTFLSTHENR